MLISMLLTEGSLADKLIYVGLFLIVIIVSLSFHEWAHAHAAHRMGDDTALNMGRMTLNPLAHLELMGFISMLIIGFGWAKPVPVNPRNYRSYKLGEFRVSLAGIFANLVIAVVASFIYVGLWFWELRTGKALPDHLFTLLSLFGIVNCSLAVFNFIPIYPLDGYHIFELVFGKVIGYKGIVWIRNHGNIIFYVFVGLSILLSRIFGISPIGFVAEWIYKKIISLFVLLFSLIP